MRTSTQRERKNARAGELYSQRRMEFFMGKCCEECGSTENLELHHRDPSTKITSTIFSRGATLREEELAKCAVLCVKCHKRHTLTLQRGPRTEHGTHTRYRSGCRCQQCKTAHTESNKEYRRRNKSHLIGPTQIHGTATRYRYGCRCDECSRAMSEYHKEYWTR